MQIFALNFDWMTSEKNKLLVSSNRVNFDYFLSAYIIFVFDFSFVIGFTISHIRFDIKLIYHAVCYPESMSSWVNICESTTTPMTKTLCLHNALNNEKKKCVVKMKRIILPLIHVIQLTSFYGLSTFSGYLKAENIVRL